MNQSDRQGEFPDSYKDFVNQYGGGYLGFIAVYSCDMKGQFFIKNNVSKEWVHENKFMPIIDCETWIGELKIRYCHI